MNSDSPLNDPQSFCRASPRSAYLRRARAAGVAWPLREDLDDAQLEARLFPPPPAIAGDQRQMPDWGWVHRELRRPNVTLALLWEEYRAGAPAGVGYSWFCDLYRGWAGWLKPTMRQTHLAGEKLFVDFAGHTAEIVDGRTGEIIPVQIFVAVLGASSFTPAFAGAGSTPRRCGARSCRIGSPRMSAPSPISAAPPGRRSATISRPGLSRPAFTSRWSTGPQPSLGQALRGHGPALQHCDPPGAPL
jgi:transposase